MPTITGRFPALGWLPLDIQTNALLLEIRARFTKTPPSGSPVLVDVFVDGVSVLLQPISLPVASFNAQTVTNSGFAVLPGQNHVGLLRGQSLGIGLTQLDSGGAADGLVVQVMAA